MMTTKQSKVTANKKPNQSMPSMPTDPRLVRLPAVCTTAALGGAQPLTSAEFLHELEEQRPQRGTRADVEELAETIMATQASATDASTSPPGSPRAHEIIKLGIDVHLDRYVVVRQIDGGAPQPPQRFSPAQFLEWAKKQTELAKQVYSCYEAGPFGYGLHRKLTALGVTNYVVRPRDWDQYGKKVKTDKRDAKQLVLHLDRYVAGNCDAFCVVRVPTEAEEQRRSRSRQRQSLQNEKLRILAQGRSDAWYYGGRLEGEWWLEGNWKELVLPPIVLELLEPLRRVILAIDQELKTQTEAIIEVASKELPIGLGKLTFEILEREICDWDRFTNRRQVASYTGMCPREDTSDQRRFQGSINKHGNRRLRTVLVEASWRLIQFQPTYKPVLKWMPVLSNSKTTKAKRKQIAVAIGRQFSVDWWRVRTQRCRAEDLGLKSKPAPVVVPPTPRAKAKKAAPTQKAQKASLRPNSTL
jgi:transposase